MSHKWLKLLTGFKHREKIGVEYFDTETLEMRKTEMFVEGYKAGLVKDTSYKWLWKCRLRCGSSENGLQDGERAWYTLVRKIRILRGNMNTPTLETERLLLRKFTENDLEALYKIYSDKEVNRFLPWFPLKTAEDAKLFYEQQFAEMYAQKCAYNYAICLKEDNYPIGYVNVNTNNSHDFGYGLRKEFWHKGIVTEAGIAVVEQLRKDGIPYITATHDVNNPRSGEVMRQLGMKYQYSYEEQWQPKDVLVTFRMYQLNLDGTESRIYKEYWNNSTVHFIETNV